MNKITLTEVDEICRKILNLEILNRKLYEIMKESVLWYCEMLRL